MEDEDVGGVAAAEGLDGGRAGVAGGRADDGGARAALGEDVIHHPGEELHRHVLEGERRGRGTARARSGSGAISTSGVTEGWRKVA